MGAVRWLSLVLVLAGCDGSGPVNGPQSFCDHGHRVYFYSGTAVSVVPNDPACREIK